MLLRSFLLGLMAMLCTSYCNAQTNPAEKKLERINELLQKNKVKDAEKLLEELLEKYPEEGKAWDLLTGIKFYNVSQAAATPNPLADGNIVVTSKDKNGKDIPMEDDSLARQLIDLLNDMSPEKLARKSYMNTMRKGLALSADAYNTAIYMRTELFDVEVDTNVNKKALKYYKTAEEAFQERNYRTAAEYYRQALESQPDFYKASLYLGDCYYAMADYPAAIKSFKESVARFPRFLEPRKFLSDAYAKEGLWDNAFEEAVATFTIYPDISMWAKIEHAAGQLGRKTTIAWMPRLVLPNTYAASAASGLEANGPDMPGDDKAPWKAYAAAKAKIAPYCNNKGIVTEHTSLTSAKYAEVFAWEQMLAAYSDDASLAAARKAQQQGNLDCYVLVAIFHPDLLGQYRDFAANNRERIVQYLKKGAQ